ncbi:MAG TPA: hypothetical protein VEQ60_08935, partial [Longimicrobium sp.]|nr:hypothetical protein [Longimicrobium sp.]
PTAGEGTAGSAADPGAPAAGAAAAEVDGSAERPVVEPDAETAFPAAALALEPYPEDAEATVGETASLQPAVQHRQADAAAEGPVTGTRPATDLRDVAWVSTVLEGARYRRVRPPPEDPSRPFAITRADLRSYRRAPVPQQMLLLVMDYTALEGVDWQEALIPHLGWAYAERASVGIVRVGSSGAANPLRADRVMARSILGPDVSAALREQPGMATPLAHGLELAAQTLQGEIQRGRSGVKRARLVVLTDGRGNVPLAASRAGALSGPVFRHGIDDALHEARVLGGMAHVETHLLNPCPRLYPDVPLALADALRAWVEDIPAAAEEPSS